MSQQKPAYLDDKGYFGNYGGTFVPDTLMAPLIELNKAYAELSVKPEFWIEFEALLNDFVGRPTSLYHAARLSKHLGGPKIYLKREDLAHTGAHKINNAIGQILLAKHMGKTRIIAETGAGQHGVASAAAAAAFGMECVIYMGAEDIIRQEPNVFRMRLMGAKVVAVNSGSQTLKDAVSEAMRDWVSNIHSTHYLLGSALGPSPYPQMVRDFQSVIGTETREQILKKEGRLPDAIIACVGGGSNAIGMFSAFIKDKGVALIGVEAGGTGPQLGSHAARFQGGKLGIFQGMKTYLLQDEHGQIANTQSVSAGLDYAGVGPEHCHLRDIERVAYTSVTDTQALAAFHMLSEMEGILPALESSHAVAHICATAKDYTPDQTVIINLSGRGDKDVGIIQKYEGAIQ